MKKCPIGLDTIGDVIYVLECGRDVYGPYASESAARKAAGRAGIDATITRVKVTTVVTDRKRYNGTKEQRWIS